MSAKPSCIKRLVIGCGSLTVGAALMTATVVYMAVHEPEPPNMTSQDLSEVFINEVPLQLGELESLPPGAKPLEIRMDFNAALVDVSPGRDDGVVDVSCEYDAANFAFSSRREERRDRTIYHLDFDAKHGLTDMLFNSDHGKTVNRISVKLPTDVPLNVDFRADMGSSDVDLGGLALNRLNLHTEKGDLTLSCSRPNQLPLEELRFRSSMGHFQVNDIQNFRFRDSSFEARYGELILSNSGDFQNREVDIDMSVAFGQARIELPRSARVHSNTTATLGGTHTSRARNNEYTTLVNLEGGVSFGDHTVTYLTRKPSIERLMQRMFRNYDSPEEAVDQVREAYRQNPDGYDFDEGRINNYGYRLLRNGSTESIAQAIEVFKFNVEIHPDYANGFDSLGEAYMEGGLVEPAITNYERSLELNPHNYNGKRMLHRLRTEPPNPPRTRKPPMPPDPEEKDGPGAGA